MNLRFSFRRRRVQPRLKPVAAVGAATLVLAAVPAIASALAAGRLGTTARVVSRATVMHRLDNALGPARLAMASPVVASRSRWSIQPTPNPSARTGQLLFGTCTSASSCVAVGTRVTASKVGVTLVERWSGGKWRVEPSPNAAGASVSSLAGVACSTPSACTAVGDAISAKGRMVTLAERWTGRRWQIQPTPNPPGSPKSELVGVACSSSSSCQAVGAYVNRSGRQVNLAERWNGKSWRIERTPTPGKGQFAYLDDVACTASSACAAVGLSNVGQPDQRAVVERWNGHRWRVQPSPNPSHGGGGLEGVACTAASSCTAVGFSNAGTLAERWNGHRWAIQPTPNPPGAQFGLFNGVGCSSRSACTAVGYYFDSSGRMLALAERWSGHQWRIERALSPDAVQGDFLLGVSCPSSASCTAFGSSRVSHFSGTPLTLVQRWNGHRWRLERTRNPVGARGAQLLFLSCTSRSFCMAVGHTTDGALAERWNGTSWAIEPTRSAPGRAVSGLDGVSCTSPSSCIAVGAAFTTFNGNPVGTLAERWNGHRWRIQPTPTSHSPGDFLGSVSCTSASACTAVGNTASGLLAERWNGTNWKTQHVPTPTGMHGGFLTGVSCTFASACTAVGVGFDSSGNFAGTITERWNGHSWRNQPTPTSNSPGDILTAVSCSSAPTCTAVGSTASRLLAERWNGTAWKIQRTPTPQAAVGQGPGFTGVSCPSRSACTAVAGGFPPSGPFTIAERWNGSRWSIQPTPKLPGIYDLDSEAVSCPTTSLCIAVGGYSNNGVKLTLAERWQAGRASAPSVAGASSTPSPGRACALPLELFAPTHLGRVPSLALTRSALGARGGWWFTGPTACGTR